MNTSVEPSRTFSGPPIMIPAIAADGSLYPVEKIRAHREGIHHLALSVFIFDGDELLLQQRAITKYHCGGQWANSCCTHPHMDESPASAAMRRVREELGISVSVKEKRVVEYSAKVGNGMKEVERVHMFVAEINRNKITLDPSPEEVSQCRWEKAQTLHTEVASNPERFTPWFRIYLQRFPDLQF